MGGARPEIVEPPQWDNIPSELAALPNWVLWGWTQRDGKWTKPPLQCDGSPAKANDPATWSPLEFAQTAFDTSGSFDGVGFVLSEGDPFTGLDFDNCLADGAIANPQIAQWVERLNSYTEVSPSGTGLRVIVKAKLPPGRRRKGDLEIYDSERFLTVTGRTWPRDAPPKAVAERQSTVSAFHAAIFGNDNGNGKPHPGTNLSDDALLDRARRAKNGDLFISLFDQGAWPGRYPSQSEADFALCRLLMFWTNGDAGRVDSLFRRSALMREKWNRPDYRERCLNETQGAEGYAAHQRADRPAPAAPQPVEVGGELALVDRLRAKHSDDLMYVPGPGYFVWRSARWQRDEAEQASRLAEGCIRDLYHEAGAVLSAVTPAMDKAARISAEERAGALTRLAAYLSSHNHIAGALRLLRPHVAVSVDDLDSHPALLNVRNGVVDLRTGELLPHSRGFRLTQHIDLDYHADAPALRWRQFLMEIFGGDENLCRYAQAAVGYSLTGEQCEKIFWVLWGNGNTGKSTFLKVILAVLGSYGQTVPSGLFLREKESIPTDVARLRGVRFACCSETAQGRRFDSEKLKNLTGDEGRLVARLMRQDYFEFRPTHHLWLATNFRPQADARDGALWNRLRLIPFNVIFEDSKQNPDTAHPMDRTLANTLMAEREGVLAWAVAGAGAWYRHGFDEPACVKAAGTEYRSSADTIAQFISACVERKVGERTRQSVMFRAYSSFFEGDRKLGKHNFNTVLRDGYGFAEGRDRIDGNVWLDCKLRPGAEEGNS